MAFLDFINNRNASPAPAIESLSANVKAQAVEAARPAARLLEQATTSQTPSVQPTTSNAPARGRSLGMER